MSPEQIQRLRTLGRAANALGSWGAEEAWAWASGVLGRGLRPVLARGQSVTSWATSGQHRVVVIAPHPDDEVMGCAGTILRHVQKGDSVRIVFVTDGSRSRAFGLDRASMRARREREASLAAHEMGAKSTWLGLPEGDWSDPEGRSALHRVLADFEPSVVYVPSGIDYHPEHCRVARISATVLSERRSLAEVRLYCVQVPLTPLLTNLIHDVSDLDLSIRAILLCYASQRESTACTLRLRRYAARFWQARKQVETFCSMTVATYELLHRRPLARFVGLRSRAWIDPLAFATGLGERLAWCRHASEGP